MKESRVSVRREAARRVAVARVSRRKSASTASRGTAARRSAMKKRVGYGARALLATLGLLLGFGVAEATTWHVRSNAPLSPQNGTSHATAFRTIALANASAQYGDLVVVHPGTYSHMPSPTSPGAGPGRVTYVGSLANPTSTTISAATISAPNVTIKGFNLIANSLSLTATAKFDSILYCRIAGITLSADRSDYTVIANCSIKSRIIGFTGTMGDPLDGFEVQNNIMRDVGYEVTDGCTGGRNLWTWSRTDSCVVMGNDVWLIAETGYQGCNEYLYVRFHTQRMISKYNDFNVINKSSTIGHNAFNFRDSSFNNITVKDTMRTSLNAVGYVGFIFASTGNAGNERSVFSNTLDSCWIFNRYAPAVWLQAGLNRWTMRRNVFVSQSDAALVWHETIGRNFIDHNTFVSGAADGAVQDRGGSVAWVDQTIFTNNILYLSPPVVPNARPVKWSPSRFDSSLVAGGASSTHLRSEHNLYAHYASDGDTVGGRSIGFWLSCCGTLDSKPGTGTMWTVKWSPGSDDSSVYGSPQFDQGDQDSLFSQFHDDDGEYYWFDEDIGFASAARAAGSAGTDIGAATFAIYPILSTATTQMNFVDGEDIAAQTFLLRIANIADAAVELDISEFAFSEAGLGISPTTATIAEGSFQDFTVTFTPTGDPTPRAGTMTIANTDPVRANYVIPVNINRSTGVPGRPRVGGDD